MFDISCMKAEYSLKVAIGSKAQLPTLLGCMQNLMDADSDRQGMNPVFTSAVDLLRETEKHGISRITALAGLVRNYTRDNFYSRDVIATLRGEAKEFHHACSGPFQQREQTGFRLFYDLYQHSKSAFARDAFSQMACNHLNAFEKGEAVNEAADMLSHGYGQAYDYLAEYPLQFAQRTSPYRAVTVLYSNSKNASPSLDPVKPYAAVAAILSTTTDERLAEFPMEQLIEYALWSLQRPAEKIGGKHDAQAHMAVMLSEKWLPDYADAYGIDKAAPFAEKLYTLAPDKYIKAALNAFMAPRLDLLAATPEQLGPAAAWALRIGPSTEEAIAFTTHNLARLFKNQAGDDSFKTLISYVATPVLDRFAETLPSAEKNQFGLMRPRSGPLKITV